MNSTKVSPLTNSKTNFTDGKIREVRIFFNAFFKFIVIKKYCDIIELKRIGVCILMKKIRYIVFVFLMMLLFPFCVTASENKVYWDDEIGGYEKTSDSEIIYNSLKYYLINNTSYNLDDVVKIVFNDVSSMGNTITLDGIDISNNKDNSVVAILEDNVTNDILYIQYSGKLVFNSDSSYLFKDFSKITRIDGLEYVDTGEVTDMSYMFSGLTKLVTINLSEFNTSKVVNMAGMFADTESLDRIDLDSFDTSNVTNMSYMFKNSDFGIGNQLYLSSFDTSNVTNMSYMFYNSGELSRIYVSNLWDVSNVTSSYCMFNNNYILSGHNGTEADIYYCHGKEYAKIDYVDSSGYLSVDLWLRSDEYEVRKDYVYTKSEKFDVSKMKVNRGELKEENNRLNVYYDGKLLESNYIISVSSSEYRFVDDGIDIGINDMDTSKINVLNGSLKYENDNIYIYHVDGSYIEQMKIVSVSSSKYDLTKEYIYIGTNVFDYDDIKVINGGKTWTNNELKMFYNGNLLRSWKTISLWSDIYDINSSEKYIYVGANDIDITKIIVSSGDVRVEDNKLNIYYGNELLDSYKLVSISSSKYDLTKDYIYVGCNKLDVSKIDIVNGITKEEENKLNVYHDDILLESYNIIIVSSDKYTIIDEEYTDYIYVGEDYIDTDKILSGIKVINGTAKFDINSNSYISIIPDGFNSLSVGSLSIITAITDISLNVTQVNLSKNNLYQIVATINPWNTLDDKTLTWTSENESVAKVYSSSGDNSIVYVSAIGSGETIITVTTKNGKSASFKVIVSGFDIEVESNNIYVSYDGKEHQIIPNVKTPGAKVIYSLDGINYNLNESPKFKNPGQYKVYYKVEVPYYEDYYGDGEVRISGILSMPSNMIIKDKFLIINNYDNSLYRLMSGINLYVLSDFFEYRYDGGLYQPETDYSGSNQFLVSTGKSFWIYIDSALEPMYSYDIVLRGDLSGDGEIDSLDLATMMNHISGKKELMGAHLEAAYLNNDEDIDSLDLAYLMNHIAGKEGY